jgi:predicted MPP superfamily phosphohydrolase
MKQKFLCYSDTHFNFTFPWTQYKFIERIADENPAGLFLTGDISCGLTIRNVLKFIASQLKPINIFFVLGNHDYYSSSFKKITEIVKKTCKEHSNLIWITEHDSIALNKDVGIIGIDSWYDARLGKQNYLHYNLDWIMIEEFRQIKSFKEKLELCRQLADQYTVNLRDKLEKALQNFQTVHILCHVPPWAEAVRGIGTITEEFWLPYNINSGMGKMIEEVMADRGNQNVVVSAGHTHQPAIIKVSHNIECVVQNGKYLGPPTDNNCVFI